MDTKNKIFAVVGTIAVLATAGIVGATLFTQKNDATDTTTASTSQSTKTTTSSSGTASASSGTATTGSYKDGTYSSTISYSVPHGETNSIKATVTISSGKIASVTTDNNYSDRESGQYISWFESSLSSDATGQSIGSYSPSRIGGASLTTDAFAEAISDIASQAQV